MKLAYRLVIKELIGPFVFGVLAFSTVFFAGTYMLRLTGWIMSGDISLWQALQMSLLLLPAVVPYTLPMSTLLAVMLGVGRLSGDSEVVALFASGISIYRIVIPVFVLGAMISAGAITINETLVPWARDRYETMCAPLLKKLAPAEQALSYYDDTLNIRIEARGGMDIDRGILKKVSIIQYADKPMVIDDANVAKGMPVSVTYADRAEWDGQKDKAKKYNFKLYDGRYQQLWTSKSAVVMFSNSNSSAKEQNLELSQSPEQLAILQKVKGNNPDQLSFRDLSLAVNEMRKSPEASQKKIMELDVGRWNKLALPLSSMIFALLGAPLGIRPSRTASSVGFGLSVGLIMMYWVVWNFTSRLAIQGNLPTVIGVFAADILGLVVAVSLMRRAAK